MRQDMSKIFTRRQHRRGSGKSWRKIQRKGQSRRINSTPLEELPFFEAMSPEKGFRKRRLGYGPLHKYLRSQAGRLWSEVYSEICAQCDLRSAAQQRFRESLNVEQNVLLIGGKPFEPKGCYQIWHRSHWVHPETGILMAPTEPEKRRYKSEQSTRRRRFSGFEKYRIDREHRLVYLDNLTQPAWYVVKLAAFPELLGCEYDYLIWDVVLDLHPSDWHLHTLRAEWGGDYFAVEKHRAKSKLIRRYTSAKDCKQLSAHDHRLPPGRLA